MLQEINPDNREILVQDERYLYFACKRCLDIALAVPLIVLLAPLMLLIAMLIKLDTPGSVFFVQQRIGARRRVRNGHASWEICTFPFYKFRSMVQNADQAVHEAYIKAWTRGQVEVSDAAHPKYKLTNDPRVTRVGRILRKTSLDELPQLFNVLKGDMSIVGPRPVPAYEVEQYQPEHYERLATLPGITGLWQVKGRCQVSFEEMIRMDIEYVRTQSLWLDIKILLLTIPAVLLAHGAD